MHILVFYFWCINLSLFCFIFKNIYDQFHKNRIHASRHLSMIDNQNYVFQNFKTHEPFNVIFLFKLLNTFFFSNSVFISKKRKMNHTAFISFLIYWKKRITNQNEIHCYRGNKIINNATVITINRRSISYIAHLSNKSHDFNQISLMVSNTQYLDI